MKTIERVTFQGVADSRAKTIWLRVTGESHLFLSGIELRDDGDEMAGRGFDERKRIIDKGTVQRRQIARMNLHYGHLETAEWPISEVTDTR